jgi:hypothetical protein
MVEGTSFDERMLHDGGPAIAADRAKLMLPERVMVAFDIAH